MKNRIIYKNKDNSVAILVPAQEVLDTVGLKAIAEKDVPQDLPYWLVNDTYIPSDRTDRDRWILEDMPEPDGFGGESNEFTDEQLKELYKRGVIK
jgi:hypothetical protein